MEFNVSGQLDSGIQTNPRVLSYQSTGSRFRVTHESTYLSSTDEHAKIRTSLN
jgi:hypothetical protein